MFKIEWSGMSGENLIWYDETLRKIIGYGDWWLNIQRQIHNGQQHYEIQDNYTTLLFNYHWFSNPTMNFCFFFFFTYLSFILYLEYASTVLLRLFLLNGSSYLESMTWIKIFNHILLSKWVNLHCKYSLDRIGLKFSIIIFSYY